MSRGVWVWVGLSWTAQVQQVLAQYGDRITDVSVFGWQVDTTGTLTQTFDPSLLDQYRAAWPHIRWWACFRNNGDASVFTALRNYPAAQATLVGQLGQILDANPWFAGVDVDLEEGGAAANATAAESLFAQIAAVPHAHGLACSAALPALTADGSVGGEDWVRYAQLGQILDHLAIMSYDMAWNGSAPGPISPADWLGQVYDWAASQTTPSKISMGLPMYGRLWAIHDYPDSGAYDRGGYRGTAGTYPAFVYYLSGAYSYVPGHATDAPDLAPQTGWLGWRDPDSQAVTTLLGVYDWATVVDRTSSTGWTYGTYQGKPYGIRYGQASASSMWAVVDDSAPASAAATYVLSPQLVRNTAGAWEGPHDGYTLTVELLKRAPTSATILDDDCCTPGQMATLWTGSGWSQWASDDATPRPTYGQYRAPAGGGRLDAAHNFSSAALHMQARLQLPANSAAGVHIGQVSALLDQNGLLTLAVGDATVATAQAPAPGTSTTPGDNQAIVGLRLRGTHVRAYASLSEQSVPLLLEADVDASVIDGTVGVQATGQAWFDHLRIGDGWWYTPAEAVRVQTAEGWSWDVGRIPRTGVEWDTLGRFRPMADVEEDATRTRAIGQDWDFDHIVDFPIATGQQRTITVIPIDTNVWLGRILLCDRVGAQEVWYSDVQTIAYWADQADARWPLQGIALWSLGQEDVRLWERISGAQLATT